MKKYSFIIVMVIILLTSTWCYAAGYTDVQGNANYADALNRLSSFGVIGGNEDGTFKPNDKITREQFAKIIVTATGMGRNASLMKGATVFPDVAADRWSSGYINLALSKGYIVGAADGNFHPTEGITMAQACTIMVRALGYTDAEIPGIWPRNYVEKAAILNLINNKGYAYNDTLPRYEIAMMVDKMMNSNIKKTNPTDADKTFYALVGNSDIVYSQPEIALNFYPYTSNIGAINLSGDIKVVRNTIDLSANPQINKVGEASAKQLIKYGDVVYEVTNTNSNIKYIQVIDHKVSGTITAILPNKFAPTAIQIDGKDYNISSYFDMSQIDTTVGSYKLDDHITALFGYDGKIVGLNNIHTVGNSDYAFVINYSISNSFETTSYGNFKYIVKLLLTNGQQVSFEVNSNPKEFKGKLVKYEKLDSETAYLREVPYMIEDPNYYLEDEITYSGSSIIEINKDKRLLDDIYVSEDVKIFDLISNEENEDAVVELRDWDDLRDGNFELDRVLCWNKAGPFKDINVIVFDDALEQENQLYKMALVKEMNVIDNSGTATFNITMFIDGKSYLYSTNSVFYGADYLLKVRIYDGKVTDVIEIMEGEKPEREVTALDTTRIRLGDKTYWLKENVAVYFRDTYGDYSVKSIGDVLIGVDYSSVTVYLDREAEYEGQVEAIVVRK